jgi:hypothetical protein
MIIHLWAKFFMAAWRGHRQMTWITGAVALVVSIGAAFTGYLSQQNFASQWISVPRRYARAAFPSEGLPRPPPHLAGALPHR